MLCIWQIQKNNPEYAFDTPVPNNPRNSRDMPLGASSIGNLAPKALR